MLELPEALSPEWEETLKGLGVTQAKSIEVWPAGLAALIWDGEGHSEWLASERPCLAVRSDHAIDAVLVSVGPGADSSLELAPIVPGEPIFIELPQLPVGLHRPRFAIRSKDGVDAEAIGDLDVLIRIREAHPWSPGVTPQGPLAFELEPASPTLEQLWEGRADLTIHGPAGRQIKCRLSMFERATERSILTKQLPPLTLPLTNAQWEQHFEKHVREARDAQEAYDTARVCELEFSADELGQFTVRCEREFTPLRWALRRTGQSYVLRLLEDVGIGVPAVNCTTFESPTIEERLGTKREYRVPSPGGLYVARIGEFVAAIIVPPVIRSFADLRCTPRIEDGQRSVENLMRLVHFAGVWGNARLAGDWVSARRQRDVLQALVSQIFRILGGDVWGEAELSASDRRNGIADLKRSVSKRREEAPIGAVLARDYAELSTVTPSHRVQRVAALVTKFLPLSSTTATSLVNKTKSSASQMTIQPTKITGGDEPFSLTELALRLASDPAHVETWAGERLCAGLARLLELSTLARAARFLVLATHKHMDAPPSSGELYAGWRWP
jgi:hypothetical protein